MELVPITETDIDIAIDTLIFFKQKTKFEPE